MKSIKDKNIPGEILVWLGSKDYKELTSGEKLVVDEYLGQKEYQDMRSAIISFKQVNKLLDQTIQEFELPGKQQSLLMRIFQYPIPAYQVAAGILLLFGLYYINRQPKTASNISTEILADSLQVGKPIAEDKYPAKLIFNP